MKTEKMPANAKLLNWDPEALDEYQQWIQLGRVLQREQKAKYLRKQQQQRIHVAMKRIQAIILKQKPA